MFRYSKEEANKRAKEFGRSLSGKLYFIYMAQIVKSKNVGFPPPAYTFDQLKKRYLTDPLYLKLHAAWVASGYNKQLAPSMDRTDSTKPYTFKNTQIMTWAENRAKQSKIDIHNSHDTPVAALIADTVVKIFSSQREAINETGALNIVKCLKDERTTSGGYEWKSLRGITKKQFLALKSKLPIAFSKVRFTPKPHRKVLR